MPIVGITDKDKPYKKSLCGKVYKGTRSSKSERRPGSDLGEKFRIEPATQLVASNLKKVYPDAQVDANGDILVRQLDIMFAYEERDKVFDAWMQFWSGSALMRRCDRHTIQFESELRDDMYGNKRHIQVPCNKPCPMREEPVGIQCPLGCTQEATITFYVRSPKIREMGIDFPLPFEMTITGFTDLDVIGTFLDGTLEKFNSLKVHNLFDYFGNQIPLGEWGVELPFVLSRSKVAIKRPVLYKKSDEGQTYEIAGTTFPKRTGKKADGVAWACLFQPNPEWLVLYEEMCDRLENERRMRQQLEFLAEMRAKGLNPSAKGISILAGGVIDVEVIDAPTTALPEAKITKEEWVVMQRHFTQYGWSKEEILKLLQSYGYSQPNQIASSKVTEIMAIASNKNSLKAVAIPGDDDF